MPGASRGRGTSPAHPLIDGNTHSNWRETIMTDPDVEAEIEANTRRAAQKNDSNKKPSIVDVVEDTVTAWVKPLSRERPSEEDLEERREENDAEQR
jgi:hypothetical protein